MALERVAAAVGDADERGGGTPARYIPALAAVDPCKFGIALATDDGQVACAGDADEKFSIQSISKVFALALALEREGSALWDAVGDAAPENG